MSESGTHERARASLERSETIIHMMSLSTAETEDVLAKADIRAEALESQGATVAAAHDQDDLPPVALDVIRVQFARFNDHMREVTQNVHASHHKRPHHKSGYRAV